MILSTRDEALANMSPQAERSDMFAGTERFTTINSCLCPVGSVDGASITTVEGIGNSKAGYHAVQGWSHNFGASLYQYVQDDHTVQCNIFKTCTLLQYMHAVGHYSI